MLQASKIIDSPRQVSEDWDPIGITQPATIYLTFKESIKDTPPKFNIAPGKPWDTFLLGWPIFRCYVQLPGSTESHVSHLHGTAALY